MKTRILSSLLFLVISVAHAQQDSQFTQYMHNTININPAYAGSRGAMSIFALHRTQWIGLDGAPTTNTASLHTPLRNNRLGIGVSIINDKIGPTVENEISGDFSYTLPVSETYKLSFGIKGTANLFDLDVTKLTPEHQGDVSLQNFNNYFTPNIGAGVYLHSDKTYLGISVPNFIETKRYDDNETKINTQKIAYYLIAGHVFDLNNDLKFKPSLLTKVVEGAPLQVDISGNFLINNKFTLGVAYRWSASVSAMAGFQVSDGLYLGYGYDHETTSLENYNSGSHELFVRYEIFKNNKKMTTPRFF